jgi:hypothetical protein
MFNLPGCQSDFREGTTMSELRNLAERNSDGIAVSLDYDSSTEEISVSVHSPSADFTLYPPNPKALDCFYHPFAYADVVLTTGRYERVSA